MGKKGGVAIALSGKCAPYCGWGRNAPRPIAICGIGLLVPDAGVGVEDCVEGSGGL